jgi:hypothetical protein
VGAVARRTAVKQKPDADWQIGRITGKGLAYIGRVKASDADAAIKIAIREYEIEPEYQSRVTARLVER